jgi:hypothetical protein
MSTTDMETFMPVAHGASANALSTNNGSRPNWWRSATWSARLTSRSSSGPRTQLLGDPLVPEDSSMTTPARGMAPPRQRSSTGYRRT